MQKIIACIVLAIILCQYAHAQSAVEGKVVDAITKEALTGASVQLKGTTSGAVTDFNGHFKLNSKAGADTIVVSYVGYLPQQLPLGASGLFVQLRRSASQLNQVVVSASREGQARTEVPVAISAISKEVLLETKPVTLDQVLNKVSGVYMVNLGNEQHTMAIRQPIGYKSLFLYLEDGIPIRTSGDFNHNALIEINMAALKSIEVIRGPASSLYGSEAIGGAVNFITQAPSQVFTARVQAEASNLGYKRTDFSASNTFGKLGVYVGGYYASQRNGIMSHSDFDKLALTLRADYQLSVKSKLTTAASLIDYVTDQTGGLDSTRFYNKEYASLHTFTYRKVNALRVRSTLEHAWNENNYTLVTLFFRNNAIGQNPFYSISNVQGNPLKAKGEINEDAFESYGLIAQHKKGLPVLNGQLIGGISFDYSPATYQAHFITVDRSTTGVYTGYIPTDSLLTDYQVQLLNSAAYAQLELNPAERLKLVAALRYDRLDYAFDNHLPGSAFSGAPDEKNGFKSLSPKLGLTYDLGKSNGLYANYSVGFAPPQITELYRGVKVPALKPSNYTNYEAGGWVSFAQHRGYLDISFYQLNGTNEIISVRLPDGSYQNQNAGRTKHQGVEYTLKYAPSDLVSIRFSGTNARHYFQEYEERGVGFNNNEMATAPRFISNTEVTFRPVFVQGLRLSLEWLHLGKYYMDAANTEYYNGYNLLNGRVGYTIKGFEIWLNSLNLANQLYATTAEKTAYGKSYRQGTPRVFHLGLGYSFAARQ
ncbi:TonB-dependent receptor [Pontibacter sp. SGAir0037]|uniref:TonB-dependent receptor n=1 Tax=Pontibacter sp. SGAir0037 TaxID=2571030 RepID=UPI0010CCCC56|nr:TonB-dependent receptor [Pontibacter sp. SGAir0037]QCR21424.1 TonB-dependent receptor [Pontibacter sp. SGAir0037]